MPQVKTHDVFDEALADTCARAVSGPAQQVRFLFSARKHRNTLVDWIIRAVSILLPALFLSAVIFQPWVEPKWMFLDALTAAELSGDCCHSHFGFVSTSGILLWTATAASCLFAAAVLFFLKTHRALFRFALTAGLLTGWLALDDAFLLHETVGPAFGIPQNLMLSVYIVLALAYLVANWRLLLISDFWLLILGGGALAASLFVDAVFKSLDPSLVLLEDSAKFFGIFCWAAYHITTLIREFPQAGPAVEI